MKRMMILVAGLIAGISLFGQEQLSLETAINTALNNNFDVKILSGRMRIAKNNNTYGAAGLLPSATAVTNASSRYDDNSQGKYSTSVLSPGVQMNWRVFDGLSAWITKEKLDLLEDISEGNTELVLENTIQAVILAYNQVLFEQERETSFRELLKLSRDRYDYEMNRKDLGLSVSFNVLQARNAYLSDSSNFLLQQLSLKNAFRNLNLLMNRPLEIQYTLLDRLSIPQAVLSKEDILAKIETSNITLRTQMLNLDLAARQTSLQKSALFPTIDVRAGTDYGWNRVKPKGGEVSTGTSFDYYANFTLNFTLFNGGNVRRAIRNATIDEEIAGIEMSALKQGIHNQALALYDLYSVQMNQLQLANDNLEAAKLNLEIAQEKFKNGSINSFNYRDIQLVYLNASLGRISTLYDIVESHTQILRLTGSLNQLN